MTKTKLTLVRPLGFSTASRHMKRAGLDYWDEVDVHIVDSLEEHLSNSSFYYFSTKAQKPYTDIVFQQDDILLFGSETSGLPESVFTRWPERGYRIPMIPGQRCLNLSNSVAIVLYEALRQQQFNALS